MAEIQPNSKYDISSRGITNTNLANFKGKPRQVVINVDDGFRPVIMDGVTLGGKSKVALVDDLSDYVPVNTYNSEKAGFAKKTELSSYETKVNAQATYATKTELTSGLAGKANTSHTHTKSQITDFPTIPDTSTLIPKSGARGELSGWEVYSSNFETCSTINKTVPDVCGADSSGVTITQNFEPGVTYTKVVDIAPNTPVTLESDFHWVDDKVPTINKYGYLVVFWCGASGVVNYIPKA